MRGPRLLVCQQVALLAAREEAPELTARSACLVPVDRAACVHERMSSLRLLVRHRPIERVLDSESDPGRR